MKMQEMQVKMGILQAESEAKTGLINAQKTTTNVQAVFEASQAAGVIAQNPGVAPVIDELLASAGFVDQNQGPVAEEVPPQAVEAAPANLPEGQMVADNTHPNLAKSGTGKAGIMRGMNTPRVTDNETGVE